MLKYLVMWGFFVALLVMACSGGGDGEGGCSSAQMSLGDNTDFGSNPSVQNWDCKMRVVISYDGVVSIYDKTATEGFLMECSNGELYQGHYSNTSISDPPEGKLKSGDVFQAEIKGLITVDSGFCEDTKVNCCRNIAVN